MADQHWLLNTGVDYPSTRTGAYRRAEAGHVVDDIPADSAEWLAEGTAEFPRGRIETSAAKLKPKPPARRAHKTDDDDDGGDD